MPQRASDILTLTAFRASALDRGTAADEPPARLLVHPWGAHDVGKRGQSIVSEATVASFEASMAALKLSDRVALDFRHNTVPGMPAYVADKEPRLVAAYGKPELVRGQGIYLTALEWTPEGKSAFLGGHFQDISPAVFRKADGTVFAIHSAALCDHGQIDGMTIAAATAPPALADAFAALTALSASLESPSSSSDPMKPTPELIALLAALGITLAADADEATTATVLKDATAKVNEAKVEKKSAEGFTADITALTARVETVEKERDSMKREALKQQAISEGKVIPLSDEVWNVTALSTCEEMVKHLKPGVVPMERKTSAGQGGSGGEVDAFSADTLALAGQFGLSEDDLKKYAPVAL